MEGVGQNRDKLGRAPGDHVLAAADADAGAQRRELGEIAVAAKAEILPRQRLAQCARGAKRRIVAVEADEAMILELGEGARFAEAGEIGAMRVEPDARRADPARDKPALGRPDHAHGNVGVATGEILVAVGERKLDGDSRIAGAKACEDRRKRLAADDLARGHSDDAAIDGSGRRGGPRKRGRRRSHGFRMGRERVRGCGGGKPAG